MASPPRSSSERVALVTGGARRIGRAVVTALARAGYDVAIHSRARARDAEEAAQAVAVLGRRSAVLAADLGDFAACRSLIADAAAALSPLTLLVNNAAVFEADEVGGLDRGLWDEHMAVNLRAPVFLAQAFAEQAPPDRDAAIVNVTDQRVLKLTPQQFSYTLSKAALHAATTMLAQALAPRVRVNAVAPGPTLPSARQDAAAFARQSALLPLERGPTPDDVAAAVVYLAAATSITGATLTVDGGQHVAWKTPDCWGIDE